MGTIYKYSFGDDKRSAYIYLHQFLSLLVKDVSNDRTLDFFSRVVNKTSDYEDRYEILAYIGSSTYPSLVFELQQTNSAVVDAFPAIFFNGTDMVSRRITLLESDSPPTGWPGPRIGMGYYNDAEYCSYNESTGVYTQVPEGTDYEPGVYYSVMNGAWYHEVGATGETAGFDSDPNDIPATGYLTSKGAMIISKRGRATIIAKTAAEKIALITPDFDLKGLGKTASFTSDYAVMADGDTVPPSLASQLSFHEEVGVVIPEHPISEQTCLCPITTHRTDVASNVVGAYCMPIAQHREEGIITVNGTRYVTNGYLALQE